MGAGSFTVVSTGQTITSSFFNDLQGAMDGDFVGRNSSGVATSGQNLGTTAIPWGTIRGSSLVLGGVAIDTSQITSPLNRLVSGKVRTTSNQPAFITPNGAAASCIVAGATTHLVFDVNGTAVTCSTDITKSSLTTAPSTQNTATVNDSTAAGQMDTRTWGEVTNSKVITITSAGTNITNLVGKWAAFKIAGVSTEYFLAFVNSSTQLTKCYRGFFYDSTLAPINRTNFSNTNTITLMNLGWVFLQNDGATVDVTYNNPVWDFTSPTSPATGDYWYDFGNSQWKRYDGASWQVISRTLIGMVVTDSTNCVAARCIDFYADYKDKLELNVEVSTTQIIRASEQDAVVSVAGNDIKFVKSLPTWNVTTMLATAADMISSTLQASRMYYLYLKDTGAEVISDIQPYYRRDLLGFYHPHNPWRCVAMAYSNGSSNLITASVIAMSKTSMIAYRNVSVTANYTATKWDDVIQASGASLTITLPPANEMVGKIFYIKKTDSTIANVITISRANSDTIGENSDTSITFTNLDERVTLMSDGNSKWIVLALSKNPTIQTFTSGTSQTYTRPSTPTTKFIKVKMIGGGGSGSGSSTISANDGHNGTAGNNTTFGTSLLTASGGGAGIWGSTLSAAVPASGGSTTVNSPAIALTQISGGDSFQPALIGTTTNTGFSVAGAGGVSLFGGNGTFATSLNTGTGGTAKANSGSGGGGGQGSTTTASQGAIGAGGGGAGGYLEAIIYNPSSSYTYTVGASTSGGAAGTGGNSGGGGAAGLIIVEEWY